MYPYPSFTHVTLFFRVFLVFLSLSRPLACIVLTWPGMLASGFFSMGPVLYPSGSHAGSVAAGIPVRSEITFYPNSLGESIRK